MADDENKQVDEPELKITIADDPPEQTDEVEKKVDAEPPKEEKKASPPPKEDADEPSAADLKQQLADLEARSKADAAAARRAEAENERLRKQHEALERRTVQSNLDTVVTAIEAAKAEADQAKANLKRLAAEGDWEAHAEETDRLTTAKSELLRLEEAKGMLEAQKKAPPRQQQQQDPVEAFASGRTEPTARWIRSHPDFVTDTRKFAKLQAAHFDAEAEQLVPDTPEYFEHIEKFLGIKKTDGEVQVEAHTRKAPKPAPKVPPAAPAANGGAPGASTSTNTVVLTKSEAKAATDGTVVWNYDDPSGKKAFKKGDPIGIQEYARRKQKMQAQGAYDRSYTEQ